MKRRSTIALLAAFFCCQATFAASPERVEQRKAALPGVRIKSELEQRQPTVADAAGEPYLYYSVESRGSWDLAKTGRAHDASSQGVAWVDELLPNGTSANYYWRKEKVNGFFWAFAKNPSTTGKYEILVSGDDITYQIWATDGEKLDRIPPAP
jgi:hypothetical protein